MADLFIKLLVRCDICQSHRLKYWHRLILHTQTIGKRLANKPPIIKMILGSAKDRPILLLENITRSFADPCLYRPIDQPILSQVHSLFDWSSCVKTIRGRPITRIWRSVKDPNYRPIHYRFCDRSTNSSMSRFFSPSTITT